MAREAKATITELSKGQAAKSNAINQDAGGRVRAMVVGMQKRDNTVDVTKDAGTLGGKSKQLEEDPFEALSAAGQLIEPPFDLLTLALLPENNTELGPCVETMEVNIEGFGYRFIPRVTVTDETPKEQANAVHAEKVRLINFFMYASIEDSFTALRRKLRADLEVTGNGYLEVIRDIKGQVQAFTHIPAYQMRLGRLEDKQVQVDVPIHELQIDGSVKVVKVKAWQRFRRYAQSKAIHLRNLSYLGGYKLRWFKAYGDVRTYDNTTGELVENDEKILRMSDDRKSNEVIHFKLYSSRSPYGLPRYIGNLLSIFGDRASEEINYITFKNQNIPSMIVMVSNGQLTEGSIGRIESFVESQIQGSDNYSKFLILEAEPSGEDGEDGGQVKLNIERLTNEQHKDALFQNYSKNNQEKVRRSFRLPPIFLGKAEDYTRDTAETSRRLADEQIFAPERDEFDSFINRRLLPDMGIIYHKFKSNSPNTTDNTQLVKILAGAEKTGGMTPRIARTLLEDILSLELPPMPADFPADVPFSLSMAEAVKNKADPTEPGQQVTALKLIDALTGSQPDGDEILVEHAQQLNEFMERKFRSTAKNLHSMDLDALADEG